MSALERRPLSSLEVGSRLADLPDWELRSGRLCREFAFVDFRSAFAFMTHAAISAEKLDHHPDWSNVYNKVRVELFTHDVNGITDFDFALASEMEKAL